jgi:A/G-specific adenine glycosylase
LRHCANAPGEPLDAAQRKDFRRALLGWFREFQRDLPWRRTRDPYRVWVSEIMLQQTRVAAVIPYYERFLERFPDPESLANAPQEEVLNLWSGLGYYSRARNLQQAAKRIVAVHGGRFPREPREVRALPGIGDYTAAAILSIAFGEKLAVLDGNVARVLARLDALRGDLREPGRWRRLQARASELCAEDAPGDWNQAMMELGATVCVPRAPHCLLCPVGGHCQAKKLGLATTLPEQRKKREAVAVRLVAAVLVDRQGNSLLLPPPAASSGRKADDHVPSLVARLWHFPIAPAKEDAESSLGEFLAGALGGKGSKGPEPELLETVRHTVTYRRVTVLPFLVRVKDLPRLPAASPFRLDAAPSLPISNLTRKIAEAALKQWRKPPRGAHR